MEETRKNLVSIQRIEELTPIPGADFVQYARVLGWNCVVSKDHFQNPGELCVFFELDALIPAYDCLSFLPANARMKDGTIRVKTRKFKGEYSQGLALPVSMVPDIIKEYFISMCPEDQSRIDWIPGEEDLGTDITQILGIQKYVLPVKGSGGAPSKSTFPVHLVSKTDEDRIQSNPRILDDMNGKNVVATLKLDGTSYTHLVMFPTVEDADENGRLPVYERRICSRNQELDLDLIFPEGLVGRPSSHYGIPDMGNSLSRRLYEILVNFRLNGWIALDCPKVQDHADVIGIAFQGELCGPGIQRNQLELRYEEVYAFNLIFLFPGGRRLYCDYNTMIHLVDDDYGSTIFKTVPMLYDFPNVFDYDGNYKATVNNLLHLAQGKYDGTTNEREGLVIRETGFGARWTPPLSFKVISNKFLQKEEKYIDKLGE